MTRFFIVLLAAGIAVLQWQLWAGRTSWDRLRELEAQLAAQKRLNAELRAGNETLAAELYSLENRRDA
ncbi:septum formation initiator family protein, partial [Sutterella parvirubra]